MGTLNFSFLPRNKSIPKFKCNSSFIPGLFPGLPPLIVFSPGEYIPQNQTGVRRWDAGLCDHLPHTHKKLPPPHTKNSPPLLLLCCCSPPYHIGRVAARACCSPLFKNAAGIRCCWKMIDLQYPARLACIARASPAHLAWHVLLGPPLPTWPVSLHPGCSWC